MTSPLVSFPLVWPKLPDGPGRVLEFSVRGGDDVQVEVTNQRTSRQCLTGLDTAQKTSSVFSLVDWVSGSDSELTSEPHAAGKTTTHVMDMRGGPATTPVAAWYMVAGMRCSKKDQEALASSLDAYLRGIFHCGKFSPVFHHFGVSKTDPDLVLSVQGWPSKEAADEYWDSDEHLAYYPAVRDLMTVDLGPFKGALSKA